ncbi:MAG: hypothetical protein ACOC00_00185 [Halothiobacillaceae bacterium]
MSDDQKPREPVQSIREALERQQAEDLDWILSDVRGQRVLMRIIERTGFMQDPFSPNNQFETAHNLGLQTMGKWLWAELFNTDARALWDAMDRYKQQQERLRDEEQHHATEQ